MYLNQIVHKKEEQFLTEFLLAFINFFFRLLKLKIRIKYHFQVEKFVNILKNNEAYLNFPECSNIKNMDVLIVVRL